MKPVEWFSRAAGKSGMNLVEKVIAHSPPFVYSHVTGIESPSGVEAEGWLITVGGTPKQLLAHSPEFTYRRLLAAAKMAEKMGAQIMGLGAFTKVVGDAGVTVAKRADLPITTGNSYSASAALWAGADAVRRLGLVAARSQGEGEGQGDGDRRHGRHRVGLLAAARPGGRGVLPRLDRVVQAVRPPRHAS